MSKSRDLASKVIFETFKILKEAGGEMRSVDIVDKIEQNLELDDYDKEVYEKTGYTRWKSILHFFTIDCIKAGYMRKNKGVWTLTKEGEEAMKLGPVKLLDRATELYHVWAATNKEKNITKKDEIEEEVATNEDQKQRADLEQLEERSLEGLREHLSRKNPYEFQDIVASLLRAMGYYTPFISPKGKDDGVDVIAYKDPLGAEEPRIKVQIKHRPEASIAVDEIRQLVGLLSESGDVGLFVTSGRFTSEAEKFARSSHKHIELINFERFISLWQEFYNKLTDDDKNILPLHPIYFLGSNE